MYDVWDIMKSNSNGKLDVNVLVLGYRMELMKIWKFYDVSEYICMRWCCRLTCRLWAMK
jgi:hypothetical protein